MSHLVGTPKSASCRPWSNWTGGSTHLEQLRADDRQTAPGDGTYLGQLRADEGQTARVTALWCSNSSGQSGLCRWDLACYRPWEGPRYTTNRPSRD
jgi:hypothetical protein